MSVAAVGRIPLFDALIQVQDEANLPLQKAEELRNALEKIASIEEIIEAVSPFATNYLFLWAAAQRAGEELLARDCLRRWGSSSGWNPESELIPKQAAEIREIEMAEAGNAQVAFVLKHFPNLTQLTIRDSMTLTPDCLKQGHASLKMLALCRVSIQAQSVTPTAFPEIEAVADLEPLKISERAPPPQKELSDWEEVDPDPFIVYNPAPMVFSLPPEQRPNAADNCIFLNRASILSHLRRFELNPTNESFEVFIALRTLCSRSNPSLADLDDEFLKCLVRSRKELDSSTWKSSSSIGTDITTYLLEEPKMWETGEWFEMGNLLADLIVTDGNVEYVITESDILRVEDLLRQEALTLPPALCSSLIKSALFNLGKMQERLFAADTHMPLSIRQTKMLTRILVELSYRMKDETDLIAPVLQKLLCNPVTDTCEVQKMQRFRRPSTESIQAGPFYHTPLAHTIACAFVTRIDRLSILQHIFDRYRGYKGSQKHPISPFYPLPKLIVGCIAVQDIEEQNTVLATRLQHYGGVFEELGENPLKESYFQALCKQEFGGGQPLQEALTALSTRETTPESWLQPIKEVLKQLQN